MKARKYQYLIVLQGWYNDVWEDLTCEDAHSAVTTDRVSGKIVTPLMRIRSDLRAYQQNEGGQSRIIRRRVLHEA